MRFVHYLISIIVAVAPSLRAQVSVQVAPDQAARLQVPQPVEVFSPVTATAAFDSPVARVGQSVYYRVAIDGAGEAAVQWPAVISAPPQLKFGPVSHGQVMELIGNSFRPLASFLYQVQATSPGHFTVPAFDVTVEGKPIQIPAATLDVDESVAGPTPRSLVLDVSATNVFLGQPLRARVMLPAGPANQIEALREVQFDGNAFMSDLTTLRQTVEMAGINGQTVPAYVYAITLTPIEAGPSVLSAQAFSAGRDFFGLNAITAHQITIPGGPTHYVFLTSNPVQVNVRPLPAGQPADFNGSIGTFTLSAPQLSTNRIQVGQPVRLTVTVHNNDPLNRLVPPAPPSANDWEIIPDNPPDCSFTLIPLSDTARQTPAIPFSGFDPQSGSYVDLTIPSLPVTVASEGLPTEMAAVDAGLTPGSPLRLGGLSPSPGTSVAALAPPQLSAASVCFQVVPILVILGLWQWDRRRRFLEAHPDIVRRRKARRLLRREKRRLRDAARRGDSAALVRHAANAMKIASAPHYAADPQALVCSDVLSHLESAGQTAAAAETVRKIFAAADARFALAPQMQADWPALHSDVDAVLLKLEEQL